MKKRENNIFLIREDSMKIYWTRIISNLYIYISIKIKNILNIYI